MSIGHACVPHPANEASVPLRDFRLDGWLVEATGNRIVKGTTVVRVRPQLVDVLSCLAARPGQVVSKAKLLSTVWNDRFVAETGVARCIAELRHILADDARRPRFIETIPKRGYRLIATVEPVPGEAAATQPEQPPPSPSPSPSPGPVSISQHARLRLVGRGWFVAAAAMLTDVARHLIRARS